MKQSDRDISQWDARLKQQLERSFRNYHKRRIDLSVARDNEQLDWTGEHIIVEKASSSSAIATVRLMFDDADPLDLGKDIVIKSIFNRVYLSNAAQADQWLDVIIGINFEYEKKNRVEFSDALFRVFNDDDVTKQFLFDLSELHSGTDAELKFSKHILNFIGTLLGRKIKFTTKTPQPLVTMIFDDSFITHYTRMKALFAAQGEVACPAIVTDQVGTGGYMSWAQIIELQAAGWEIMSHTKTHPDLSGLTEAQVRAEFELSDVAFRANGLRVQNLAYPFNLYNEQVRRIAREYFRSARGGSLGYPNFDVINTYELEGNNAEDHTKLAEYQALVDTAETNEQWLIFYFHTTDDDDETMINNLIDYIQGKSIDIVTVNQALDLMENQIDIASGLAIGERGLKTDRNILLNANLILGVNNSRICMSTKDGNDAQFCNFCGGGYSSSTRGAYVQVRGNEAGSDPGQLLLVSGNVAGGEVSMHAGGAERVNMDANRVRQFVPASSPAPLTPNSSLSFYLDEAGHNLKATVKYSGGSVKTATIPLV